MNTTRIRERKRKVTKGGPLERYAKELRRDLCPPTDTHLTGGRSAIEEEEPRIEAEVLKPDDLSKGATSYRKELLTISTTHDQELSRAIEKQGVAAAARKDELNKSQKLSMLGSVTGSWEGGARGVLHLPPAAPPVRYTYNFRLPPSEV